MYSTLSFLNNSQYFSREQLKEYQENKLRQLFKHAKAFSPYYKDKLPDNITLDGLHKIDFIDKSILRKHSKQMCSSRSIQYRKKTTSGSTGAAVTVYKNASAMSSEYAAAWRGYSWAGVNVGDRQVRFWGVPQSSLQDKLRARLIDFVCNRHRISAFDYNSDSWERHIRLINKFKPDYFYGYVSIIKELANYIKKNNKSNLLAPKVIFTTSEVLTKYDREYLSETFGCRVFNEYGCGEFNTIAHECEHGRLHINAENLIVETIDETGKTLPPGRPGEIVITDLNNFLMPIIRYKLADWGEIADTQCLCGRGLPVIENIFGRAYDQLINKAGKKFHGEFFLYTIEDAKKHHLPLEGVQFLQKKNGDLLIYIVCDDGLFTSLCQFIKNRLRVGFDEKIAIEFKKVRSIERERSGKLRVVKREA